MASLGRLVAGVAHELNNPIQFRLRQYLYARSLPQEPGSLPGRRSQGRGCAEVETLRSKLKIDSILADIDPLLEGTIEGADRISDIVKNLRRLSFSKTAERQPVDLDRLLRNTAHLAIRSKNSLADVVVDSRPDLIVNAHEGQIHQVVVNLIDNALDATARSAAPKVRISAVRLDSAIEIRIADNGPGIAEEDMGKIFEPFLHHQIRW